MSNTFPSPRVVLGVGTGRCGTLTLARILNDQPGFSVSHELLPALRWTSGDPAATIAARLQSLKAGAGENAVVGDVAFFYLPYLDQALNLDGELRVICVRRPREEVVASFRRWVSCTSGWDVNHWAPPGGGWRCDARWSPCFPQYEVSDMSEGIRRYWEEYHQEIDRLAAKYAGRVALFEMEEALNTRDGQRRLLDFVGAPRTEQILRTGIRLHQNNGQNAGSSPKVSLIVTCKRRLHHLKQTLPTMFAQRCSFDYQVIVVDYGCPDGTFEWCKSLNKRGLVAMRVHGDTDEFNRSHSRNCGAAIALGEAYAFVDADIRLHESWLVQSAQAVLSRAYGLCRVANHSGGWDRIGTHVVAAEIFHRVRGFDEAFRGWGTEDMDFYRRCAALAKETRFPASLLSPIKHDHQERIQFHSEKSIFESQRRNLQYLQQRTGPVNSAGYGGGRFEIFQGAGNTALHLERSDRRRFVRAIRRPCHRRPVHNQ